MFKLFASLTDIGWIADLVSEFKLNFIDGERWQWLVDGLLNTLLITLFATLIGIAIGICIAIVRSTYDKNEESLKKRGGMGYVLLKIANAVCNVYLTVIRGTPVVVQLLIWYFVIMASSTNGTLVAIIAFGTNS
ncbi:MAG: amino acid ABC transporter permease, partial [Clostridia bacterium]|nr:amino acid ABC transporter permease [Clostridia bacterium]